MKKFKVLIYKRDKNILTFEDFNEFLNAKSYEHKLEIINLHSEKNNLRIEKEREGGFMDKTTQDYEKEILEMNKQFSDFLHTKGIGAKFKLAFSNMKENAKRQKEIDKANFEAVKAKSYEENKDFVDFLHTKGFKAKVKLVIENIKKGAKEAPQKTASNIAKVKAQTQAQIKNAQNLANPYSVQQNVEYDAKMLEEAFVEFLKSKGLDKEYSVEITEEE